MFSDSVAFQPRAWGDRVRRHPSPESSARPSAAKVYPALGAGLKVLIVAFQGGKQADGGVESLTQLIERYESLQITVLSQTEAAKNERWRAAGCRVLIWPLGYEPGKTGKIMFTLLRFFRGLTWNIRIARLAINQRFDVVHINDPHALWHVIFGLRLLGIPTLYNIRDTKPAFSARDRFKWRCSFRLTQAQIVLSREMRNFWRYSLNVSGKHLGAIYSIVDFRRMSPPGTVVRTELRKKLGLPDTFVAGYVASFSEKKAQLAFIEKAGPELRKKLPGAKVYFIGDYKPDSDPYAAQCERAVEAQGQRDQFIFRGYTADVAQWYQALDAVIVATRNEGMARCMIESLACGTPVISFDVCSAREILERGGCGAVVRQGDYISLVETLAQWSEDKTRRTLLGRQGAQLAKTRFAGPAIVRGYMEIYSKIAGRAAQI